MSVRSGNSRFVRGTAVFGLLLVLACITVETGAQIPDRALEAVARESQKYAQCLIEADVPCIDSYVPWDLLSQLSGRSQTTPGPTLTTSGVMYTSLREQMLEMVSELRGSLVMMDAADPGEVFEARGRLFSVVPFRTQRFERRGTLHEQSSYMLSVSEDGGRTWRFINGREPRDFDGLVPGFSDMSPPPISGRVVVAPKREKSRYLQTSEAAFAFIDGAAIYDLLLEVRRDPDADIEVLVAFDNPSTPRDPALLRTRLMPDQLSLRVLSPPLSGFERGQIYDVWIYGSDPVTEEDLFEHHQPMLFVPTNEQFAQMTVAQP